MKAYHRLAGGRFGVWTWVLAGALLALSGCESVRHDSRDLSFQLRKSEYQSRFGVMNPAPNGRYRVYAETTYIYKNVDSDYAHGFEVVRKDGGRFMAHFEVRFPAPITITPELERAYIVSDGGRRIQSQSEVHWGIFSSPFWFSEDDPLGQYELTIYIDGETYRTIRYDVVPYEGTLPF